MTELIPLSSAKADHYAKLRARLAVQKASKHEAIAAIDELCRDNERLALRSQASVAAALEAAAEALQKVADNWDCGHNESRLCDCAPYVEQWGLAADEIRALITPAQHDALAAHVASEVARARAEDAAKISQLEALLAASTHSPPPPG